MCSQENCAECAHCLDMKKYGGQNKLHQACQARRCQSLQRPPPPATLNKKVRERWSMLPHTSGASSHSEGEQQLPSSGTTRKKVVNTRRSAPPLRSREESDDSEGEAATANSRKGPRRPARKPLLTVTRDDPSSSPAVIRNLADVKGEERREEQAVRGLAAGRGLGSATFPADPGRSNQPHQVIGVPAGLSALLAKVKTETKALER